MMQASAPLAAAPAVPWPRVLLVGLLTMLGVGLLAGLGLWQLERRAWKLDLIQTVNTRYSAPVHALPADALREPDAHAYERVQLTGTFLRDRDTWVHASTERGSGYWVLTPLQTPDGLTLLINRGFVPIDTPRTGVERPRGGHVTGVLRTSETRSLWPRSNQPAQDRWYARDVATIARVRALPAVAPFFIDADPAVDAANTPGLVQPVGGLTVVHFRNAHLSYALTWFCLALMTAIAGTVVLRGELLGRGRSR